MNAALISISRRTPAMRYFLWCLCTAALSLVTLSRNASAQNPIITDQYTADPSARVFEGRVYLYPSHDIPAGEGRGRAGWFCMEDYHVFSSSNLVDWTDHGVIVRQDSVPWVNAHAFAMWAPDCVSRNGRYYFYFPAPARDTALGRGFSIGVAVSDRPYGPFVPDREPLRNVRGIDPNPFIDRNGQAYLYWAARNFYVVKLAQNMREIESEPQVIQGLPEKGLKEGPYMFERNGKYYLTYPHVQEKTERLEYAIGDSPTGPFRVAGVIMDESPECWTNHQSIIEFSNQWYLFYHHNDLSPRFDKNRSVRIDSLFFNDDGTIRKVVPTLRGVGVTEASRSIQLDRYSLMSERGASVGFLDTLRTFDGWKTLLNAANAWIQYNTVDFGGNRFTSVHVRVSSKTGGVLQLRLDGVDGPVIARVAIPRSNEWTLVSSPVSGLQSGIHNLAALLTDDADVEIDWIRFE